MTRGSHRGHPGQTGVVYVANSPQIGGGNRVLTHLLRGLDRSRFAPLLVVPKEGPLVDWAQTAAVPWQIVPDGDWTGRAALFRRAARLVPLLLRAGARIVHAMDPLCYRAAGLAGRVAAAARVCHLGFPVGPSEIQWSFRYGPDVIVACHEGQALDVAGELDLLGLERRVVAVPNAVDTDAFAPAAGPGEGAAERWRGGAKHVVLIVGHLSEVKGYPTFLRAAAKVASAIDGCAFLALGGETVSPGYRSHLEQLALDLGVRERVHFLGWRKEVAEVLQAADVVVLPSLVEGLPMAILEAMACARPVVATGVNGTREAVVDGVTGLLVPPNDAEALASALIRLLQQPDRARRMGQAGRQRVEQYFSLGRFVAGIEGVYDELLTGPTAARDCRRPAPGAVPGNDATRGGYA